MASMRAAMASAILCIHRNRNIVIIVWQHIVFFTWCCPWAHDMVGCVLVGSIYGCGRMHDKHVWESIGRQVQSSHDGPLSTRHLLVQYSCILVRTRAVLVPYSFPYSCGTRQYSCVLVLYSCVYSSRTRRVLVLTRRVLIFLVNP